MMARFPVFEDPMFTVRSVALNHRIPSFAYVLQEQFHVNINKERCMKLDSRSAIGSRK